MDSVSAIYDFIKDAKLKRCPFCGHVPVRFEDIRYPDSEDNPCYVHGIMCPNELCIMHQREKFFRTEEAANIAWNTRKE